MPSGFDRPSASSSKPQLGIGTDFDLGKSAWTTSSRIWGSSNSFLDASADDEPMKRTFWGLESDRLLLTANLLPQPHLSVKHPHQVMFRPNCSHLHCSRQLKLTTKMPCSRNCPGARCLPPLGFPPDSEDSLSPPQNKDRTKFWI